VSSKKYQIFRNIAIFKNITIYHDIFYRFFNTLSNWEERLQMRQANGVIILLQL